ncbi:hypothetical protein EJ377_17745 [Chryseobacterium arthrosphaerae]|uniref:Uncharacterized protein n=1 Tax=Chryseobacterium arthrosphaerae TaxID=651561 RepID=A0A3S0N1Z2_9FLAO|nr:hypothetical protein EJ377_17745 [Chryseobacterium arthrosphaerae]
MSEIVQKIKDQKIVPLFYNESFEVSKNIIKALYEAGIRVIEYTNRVIRHWKILLSLKKFLIQNFPDFCWE